VKLQVYDSDHENATKNSSRTSCEAILSTVLREFDQSLGGRGTLGAMSWPVFWRVPPVVEFACRQNCIAANEAIAGGLACCALTATAAPVTSAAGRACSAFPLREGKNGAIARSAGDDMASDSPAPAVPSQSVRGRHLSIAVAFVAWTAGSAVAQPAYPNRPVRIIVPYGPGGVADTTMRLIADKLTQKLGQQFIVDNRPGAGGIVAAKAAAQAAPDGYVLHLTSNGTAISTALFRQLPYDVLRDFTPITITAWFDLVVATKSDAPLQTVGDVLKAARQSPGKLNFGTIAPGSTQNLSAELFKSVAGIDAAVVTYRTTPELVTGLMRGDVQVGFEYYAGLNAAVSGGQLKAVATTGSKRTPALPAVPTVGESGLPAYVVESWNALSGPGGMSDEIVKFLNRAVNDVLSLPEVKEKAMLNGMEVRGTSPQEMQSRMKADIAKWTAVIERAGIERQ
jgi:tripartite-type tricarboxylate transporter receptor subunit TctC